MRIQDNHIFHICKILSADTEVVSERDKFYLALGLSPAALVDLNRHISTTQNGSFTFFKHAIVEWTKQNPRGATMEALIKILSNEKFHLSADELVAKVPELDRQLESANRDRIIMIYNNFDLLCKETHINVKLLLMCQEDGFMTEKQINDILNSGPDEKDINSCFYQTVLNAAQEDQKILDKLVKRMSEKVTKQSETVLEILK